MNVPVVSLVQSSGAVRSRVMVKVNEMNLKAHFAHDIAASAKLMTDQHRGYMAAGRELASHEVVDHRKDEFVRGTAHTNTLEGYFSRMKWSLYGTYHHVSSQHLHCYLSRFDCRYNTRKMDYSQQTILAFRKMAGSGCSTGMPGSLPPPNRRPMELTLSGKVRKMVGQVNCALPILQRTGNPHDLDLDVGFRINP